MELIKTGLFFFLLTTVDAQLTKRLSFGIGKNTKLFANSGGIGIKHSTNLNNYKLNTRLQQDWGLSGFGGQSGSLSLSRGKSSLYLDAARGRQGDYSLETGLNIRHGSNRNSNFYFKTGRESIVPGGSLIPYTGIGFKFRFKRDLAKRLQGK